MHRHHWNLLLSNVRSCRCPLGRADERDLPVNGTSRPKRSPCPASPPTRWEVFHGQAPSKFLTQASAWQDSPEMGDPLDPRERPFRFGVFMGDSYTTGAQWMDAVRRAKAEGGSTLRVGDHYIFRTSCTGRLAMAAAVTTTLRLGSYVYCNDFRHP